MNAKELMMGFYVRLNKDSYIFEKNQILRVLSITYYKYLAASVKCQDASGYVCILEIDNIDPIPLTVDILKDFGFELPSPSVHKYVLHSDYIIVFAKEIDNGVWEIDIFNTEFNFPPQSAIVFHVHQLQQWLRFCGIEREIEMSSLTSINTI